MGSRRGAEGGDWMARPASEVTVADIVADDLPADLEVLVEDPDARARR